MGRRLPPMNSLRVFEAVARHCSMTQAAVELRVTHSAVSRHVSLLEDYLRTQLFERKAKRLSLTRQGAAYAAHLKNLFDGLEVATQATFDAAVNNTVLNVNLQPTVAARWIVPRLTRFSSRHPEVALQLNTVYDDVPADFERSNVDFSICPGDGKWPGLHAIRLFDEVLTPACSPTLTTSLKSVNDIGKFVLLHSQQREHDWMQWLKAAGATGVDAYSGLRLGNSHLAYQAAILGLGITMAQTGFICDDLKHGRLIALFERKKLRRNRAYYAVFPIKRRSFPKVAAFSAWLEKEADMFHREYGAFLMGTK